MINILLSGCNGNMGHVITSVSDKFQQLKIAAGYDINTEKYCYYNIYDNPEKCTEKLDVCIDFSHPAAFGIILGYCKSNKIPLVMATTGLSKEQLMELENASSNMPVFFSANMSLGINMLVRLVKQAAKKLHENFDIEIIEKHHNQKIDAPSGTAFYIANSINEELDQKYQYVFDRHSYRKKRAKDEIGIHAVRGGTIAGEHSVIFAGNDEILEINHSAISKEIFAIGALKAAIYLHDKKPGMYSMDDLLAL